MALCDSLLEKGLDGFCGNLAKGCVSEGKIINRDDIDFDASQVAEDGTIKSIVLKSTKKGFKVIQPGNTPYTGTTTSLNVGTYMNTFTHTVSLVVLANDADVNGSIIDKLANGEFVVVLQNKNVGDADKNNGKFQVYGWDNGLRASAIDNDKYSDDTNGGWSVRLQETGALKSARFLVGSTKTETTSAYEALTAS